MESSARPPRIVGRYAMFDAFASGGMATVHLGRLLGPAGFSRTVAIKRLHENLAQDPELVAMFRDEARLVARIRHPNVVPTLDVVALGQELLLVMEYVAGESLSLLLRRARAGGKPPPIPVVVDILISVLHGLHAAHEATGQRGEPLEIVHRDVSPQNIIVGTDGVARVLDFGVARAIGRAPQTGDGPVKGKVQYMPIEQLTGHGVTRAVDIYAASVVLWEALTGRRRFEGENEAETMYAVLHGGQEPPSASRPDVPRELDAIVLRGMARSAADRFATAKDMARALEAAVAPVKRSAVADWVLESARDDIEQRERRVALVEGDLTVGPRPSAPPPARGEPTTGTLTPAASSSASQALSRTSHPEPSRRPRPALVARAAGAVVVVLVAATAFVAARASSAPAAAGAPPAAPVLGAETAAPVVPVATALPPPAPASADAPIASAAPASSTPSRPAAAAPPRAPRVPAPNSVHQSRP